MTAQLMDERSEEHKLMPEYTPPVGRDIKKKLVEAFIAAQRAGFNSPSKLMSLALHKFGAH